MAKWSLSNKLRSGEDSFKAYFDIFLPCPLCFEGFSKTISVLCVQVNIHRAFSRCGWPPNTSSCIQGAARTFGCIWDCIP